MITSVLACLRLERTRRFEKKREDQGEWRLLPSSLGFFSRPPQFRLSRPTESLEQATAVLTEVFRNFAFLKTIFITAYNKAKHDFSSGSETVLDGMSSLRLRIQRRLRPWSRAIQYSCTISLAVFTIFVYFISGGELLGSVPRWDVRNTKAERNIRVCPSNTVPALEGCAKCPLGTFSFAGWSECKPWLDCSQISQEVRSTSRFHHGVTKLVWHARWNGHHVVFVNCSTRNAVKRDHCSKGLSNLAQIQGEFATRLIGRCHEKLQVKDENLICDKSNRNITFKSLAHHLSPPLILIFSPNEKQANQINRDLNTRVFPRFDYLEFWLVNLVGCLRTLGLLIGNFHEGAICLQLPQSSLFSFSYLNFVFPMG